MSYFAVHYASSCRKCSLVLYGSYTIKGRFKTIEQTTARNRRRPAGNRQFSLETAPKVVIQPTA